HSTRGLLSGLAGIPAKLGKARRTRNQSITQRDRTEAAGIGHGDTEAGPDPRASATAPPSLGSTSGSVACPQATPATCVPLGPAFRSCGSIMGPGYRVYLIHRGPKTVVLLCGGNDSTQDCDIGRAKELAKEDRDGS